MSPDRRIFPLAEAFQDSVVLGQLRSSGTKEIHREQLQIPQMSSLLQCPHLSWGDDILSSTLHPSAMNRSFIGCEAEMSDLVFTHSNAQAFSVSVAFSSVLNTL